MSKSEINDKKWSKLKNNDKNVSRSKNNDKNVSNLKTKMHSSQKLTTKTHPITLCLSIGFYQNVSKSEINDKNSSKSKNKDKNLLKIYKGWNNFVSKSAMDIRFRHPFTCIVAGPTQTGKTHWVKRFVDNCEILMNQAPQQIYYAYTEWQPIYKQLPQNVQLSEGLPDLSTLRATPDIPKLLILDDLMAEMKQDKRLMEMFTKGCHHWNLSCIHIVQNVFFEGLRTSRINAQYIVLMKNPSDKLQAMNLAKQLYPEQQKYFLHSYKDATEQPYGYLLLDLSTKTEDHVRLRTDIFPGETPKVYMQRN